MIQNLAKHGVFFLFLVTLAACQQHSNKPVPAADDTVINQQGAISPVTIADTQGHPIGGAKVLIGTQVDAPFKGNFVVTNSAGQFSMPAEWTGAQPVTIDAVGFVRATYLGVVPVDRVLQLRRAAGSTHVEISGQPSNMGDLKKDGTLDVALVSTPSTRAQLLNFQISNFVSTTTDVLKLPLGNSKDIPSNLAIPKQKEKYVIELTLDKPAYRFSVEPNFSYRVLALHVRFPFKSTMDQLKNGKSIFDLLSSFEFMSAGYRDVVADTNLTGQDIALGQIPLTQTVTVKGPTYDSKQYAVLSASWASMGALYMLSDLKSVDSDATQKLKFPDQVEASKGTVLSLLRKRATDAGQNGAQVDFYSTALTSPNDAQAVQFLPLINAPKFTAKALTTEIPRAPQGVAARGMYAIRSRVILSGDGKQAIETKQPEWDLFSDTWTGTLTIPDFPKANSVSSSIVPDIKQRWEVLFLGNTDVQTTSLDQAMGPNILESVTHVTKSAVDL